MQTSITIRAMSLRQCFLVNVVLIFIVAVNSVCVSDQPKCSNVLFLIYSVFVECKYVINLTPKCVCRWQMQAGGKN